MLGAGAVLTLGTLGAGIAGPWLSGLAPRLHVYPAIVWTLTMDRGAFGRRRDLQLYALARSLAGRMTPRHDADVRNVTVYHHFLAVTAIVAYGTIGLFPGAA
ncbi:hypothetical protein AB5I41_24635 [Sphingomonas sp. MMS24-JH45]